MNTYCHVFYFANLLLIRSNLDCTPILTCCTKRQVLLHLIKSQNCKKCCWIKKHIQIVKRQFFSPYVVDSVPGFWNCSITLYLSSNFGWIKVENFRSFIPKMNQPSIQTSFSDSVCFSFQWRLVSIILHYIVSLLQKVLYFT